MVKNLPANVGITRGADLIPGLGRFPRRRKYQLAPIFFPEKFQGQRNLADYSWWGHKELDPTEQRSTHTHVR